jgi:hypothetical protein
MMHRLVLMLIGLTLMLPAGASGQGYRVDGVVTNQSGRPQPGATIAVLTQPANTSTRPGTPLAVLYVDSTLTVAAANPITADGLGNYHFYAATGVVTLQFYGTGLTTYVMPDQTVGWGTPDEIYVEGAGKQTHHVLSTAASTTITISVGAAFHDPFTSSDVGKVIRVILRNPASLEDFETTIVSVTSVTKAVLAVAPTITSTTGEAYWFSSTQDDTAALQAAINTNTGTLRLGKGVYVITDSIANKRSTTKILGAGSWRTTILLRKANLQDSLYFTDVMGLNLEGFSVVGPGMDTISGGTITIKHSDFDNVQRFYVRDVYVRQAAFRFCL